MPGTKTAICRARARARRARATIVLPDPVLPRLPLRAALAGARPGTCRSIARPAGLPTSTLRRATTSPRLPELPLQPVRGLRARGRLRGRGRVRARDRRRVVHDFAYGDIVFDGRAPQSVPRRAGREGGRRRDVLDVEDLRDGRLAARVRRRQRGDRGAARPARRPHARRDLRAVQHAGIAALTGPQDSVAERVETYRRRRDRVREVLRPSRSRGHRSTSGGSCPEGLTAERLLRAPRRGRARRRLRPARRGLGSALARGHGRGRRDRARAALARPPMRSYPDPWFGSPLRLLRWPSSSPRRLRRGWRRHRRTPTESSAAR